MIFILFTSAIAVAIMVPIFLCLRTSRVPGIASFSASALLASTTIALSASALLLQPDLVSLLSPPPMILAALLLLSGFRQVVSRPALHPLNTIAIVLAVAGLNTIFSLVHESVVGRTFVAAGSASVILATIAWTMLRAQRNANTPRAFILFAIISASAASALFMVRCLTVATGIDGASDFTDPTPWNLATSSIRILSFPVVYLSAILLVQGRTIVRLQRSLTYDDLTGALSRRAFLEVCARLFDRGSAASNDAALLLLDLDRFKEINDCYGHNIGDKALEHFVKVVSKVLPSQARLGRLGGEEFAILLPPGTATVAASIGETILKALRNAPLNTDDQTIPMAVSIGIATMQPGDSIDDAFKRADDALYRAKTSGRDRLCLADKLASITTQPNDPAGARERRQRRSQNQAASFS